MLIYSKVILDSYDFELIKTVSENSNIKEPDLEIILDAPSSVIKKRIENRNRLSKSDWAEKDWNYLNKIVAEFRNYYKKFDELKPIYIVDASDSIEKTCGKVIKIIDSF